MHLADGILSSVPIAVSLNACGACGLVMAVRRAEIGAKHVAWTGTLAAFVLAIQALNLPVLPGASAHAIGAGLLTLAVGPARAIVALFAVLAVQALLFADGGVTVLGINTLNIAVIPAVSIQLCRKLFGETRRGLMLTAFVGTALGNVIGAASLTAALVLGAAAPAAVTSTWLIGIQTLAGLVEGGLTALAVSRLLGRAPGLLAADAHVPAEPLPRTSATPAGSRNLRVAAVAFVIVLMLLPFASSSPDALEVVLERLHGGP